MARIIDKEKIEVLLQRWALGDEHALDELMPFVYDELRRIAGYLLRDERSNHTLQATALVNEAWIKLARQRKQQWENATHFRAVAARAMRQVLVEHARKYNARKRKVSLVPLTSKLGIAANGSIGLLILDDALDRLAKLYPVKARVWELRYFGGLENQEVAAVLGISSNTVIRYWNFAQDWLSRELEHRQKNDGRAKKES